MAEMFKAYGQLTYGRRYPRVVAGDGAKNWLIKYVQANSTFPFLGGVFQESVIESGDVPDGTFRFIPDPWVEENKGESAIDINVLAEPS